MKVHPKQQVYEQAEEARTKQTNDILSSPATRKIVVAGPGTGKTYLFRELLKLKSTNSLTLTFINALVDELSLSLFGLSEIRTLHGYALNALQERGFKLSPRLPEVVKEDAQVLVNKSMNFKDLFLEEPGEVERAFYEKRRDYYGKYYGFSDIIYALVQHYKDPDTEKDIPTYDQIVVDEFQDFNKFEVELIDLLATKSPILIVGDDDQSLYFDLKKATPKHIRRKHSNEDSDYVSFPLSYCSRSTEVIVDAINDLISTAVHWGLLKERVPKTYKYFPSEGMDSEGEKHPKIIFRPVYSQFLTDFLKEEISHIAALERKPFEVLIVVPNAMKNVRFPQIIKSLEIAGFRNVQYSDKSGKPPTLIDGLSLMQEDPDTNLGWRIVLKAILEKDGFEELLKRTQSETDKKLCTMVSEECAIKVRRLFDSFQRVVNNESVEDQELTALLRVAGYAPEQIAKEKLREEFYSSKPPASAMRGIKDLRIHVATILGSKGLAADYVFLMDFCDNHFAKKGKVTDRAICDFLVSMTRARKQMYLISPDDKEAIFLGWIKSSRVDRQRPYLKRRPVSRA